jgi:hypothetical protein
MIASSRHSPLQLRHALLGRAEWQEIRRSSAPISRSTESRGADRARLAGNRQRVSESQLDERLSAHADSLGFAVNGAKQIDRKIDIDTLDFSARAARSREIDMSCEVFSTIVHLVQASSA